MKEEEKKKYSQYSAEDIEQLKQEAFTAFRDRHIPALIRGIMKGVLKLDEESRKVVFREQASACAQFCRDYWHREKEGVEFPKGTLDIDSALEYFTTDSPHRRTYERTGDSVSFTAHVKESFGGCMCPLVLLGIIEPEQQMCLCCGYFYNDNFEYLTGKPWDEPEVLQTMCVGDSHTCNFRLGCKNPPDSSK